jgi:hypothetical protein
MVAGRLDPLPSDWPDHCQLTNKVLTLEFPKAPFHKCKPQNYKEEGGLHANHAPVSVDYLHKNFQGAYAGNDFTWKKHYDIPLERLEEHKKTARSIFESRIVDHPFEGQSLHEADDHFFKTVNLPYGSTHPMVEPIESLYLAALSRKYLLKRVQDNLNAGVEDNNAKENGGRGNIHKGFGFASGQNTVLNKDTGVAEPALLDDTMDESQLFADLSIAFQKFMIDTEHRPFENEERSTKFARTIHPDNLFEVCYLVGYFLPKNDMLLAHGDTHNCPWKSHSFIFTVWQHVYFPELEGVMLVGLIGTARKSCSDFIARKDRISTAGEALLAVLEKEPKSRKNINVDLLCPSTQDHMEMTTCFDPSLHLSLFIWWVEKFSLTFGTDAITRFKVIELALCFFLTPNPIFFHEICLHWSQSMPAGCLPVIFANECLQRHGGVSGGPLARYQSSFTRPMTHLQIWTILFFLNKAIDFANADKFVTSKTSYLKLLTVVRLAPGFGNLLGQKFIVAMCYLGIIKDAGLSQYQVMGSGIHLRRLRKWFGYDSNSQMDQTVRYIKTVDDCSELEAEERICVATRLLANSTHWKDISVRFQDLFSMQVDGMGAVRMILKWSTRLQERFYPRSYPSTVSTLDWEDTSWCQCKKVSELENMGAKDKMIYTYQKQLDEPSKHPTMPSKLTSIGTKKKQRSSKVIVPTRWSPGLKSKRKEWPGTSTEEVTIDLHSETSCDISSYDSEEDDFEHDSWEYLEEYGKMIGVDREYEMHTHCMVYEDLFQLMVSGQNVYKLNPHNEFIHTLESEYENKGLKYNNIRKKEQFERGPKQVELRQVGKAKGAQQIANQVYWRDVHLDDSEHWSPAFAPRERRLKRDSVVSGDAFGYKSKGAALQAFYFHVLLHGNGGRCDWARSAMDKKGHPRRLLVTTDALKGKFLGVLYYCEQWLYFREVSETMAVLVKVSGRDESYTVTQLLDPIRLCPRHLSEKEFEGQQYSQSRPIWADTEPSLDTTKPHSPVLCPEYPGLWVEQRLRQNRLTKTCGVLDRYWYTPSRTTRFRSTLEVQSFYTHYQECCDEHEAVRRYTKDKKKKANERSQDQGGKSSFKKKKKH